MPRTIGTGTRAMTGKGTSSCVGGKGRGGLHGGVVGRGLCGWFNASELAEHTPRENEESMLRQQADALRKQQDEIHTRLSMLRK